MDSVSVRVEGLAELQATLDRLKTEDAQRILTKGLREGAKVFQAAIAERAPERAALPSGTALPAGAMRRDVAIRTRPAPGPGAALVTVGPGKYTAHVARWVEFGHRLVRGGRSRLLASGKSRGPGKSVGEVKPHPFLRPAFESAQREALAAIEAKIRLGVGSIRGRKGVE